MSFREHLRYWVHPLLFSVLFIFCYYVGSDILQEIIAPKINREFGLVENMQNILILLIVYVNFFQAQRSVGKEKIFHIGALLLFCFLFAEEIDYGLHWIEYARGISQEEQAELRNIHNQGEMLNYMRITGNLILAGFAVMPYAYRGKNNLLKQLMPSEKTVFTVIVFIIVSRLSYFFVSNDYTGNGALNHNRAEFEEVVLYYIFCVYFHDLMQKADMRPGQGNPSANSQLPPLGGVR